MPRRVALLQSSYRVTWWGGEHGCDTAWLHWSRNAYGGAHCCRLNPNPAEMYGYCSLERDGTTKQVDHYLSCNWSSWIDGVLCHPPKKDAETLKGLPITAIGHLLYSCLTFLKLQSSFFILYCRYAGVLSWIACIG